MTAGSCSCEALLARLAEGLVRRNKRVATAESCTGGGVACAMTDMAGSSRWFERGFVSYSNEAKTEQLSVPAETIARFGAVSEEVAAAMAAGALRHSRADFGVAVTGIAGPDGGSADKPVGTVCFGWSRRRAGEGEGEGEGAGEPKTLRVLFAGDRQEVREQSVEMALQGLLDLVETDLREG